VSRVLAFLAIFTMVLLATVSSHVIRALMGAFNFTVVGAIISTVWLALGLRVLGHPEKPANKSLLDDFARLCWPARLNYRMLVGVAVVALLAWPACLLTYATLEVAARLYFKDGL
jgi:hypothetical protein